MTKEECVEKLNKYYRYPKNWDCYGADRPGDWSIEKAREIISLVHTFPAKIEPSVEGGVTIKYENEDRMFYIFVDDEEEIFGMVTDSIDDSRPTMYEITNIQKINNLLEEYLEKVS